MKRIASALFLVVALASCADDIGYEDPIASATVPSFVSGEECPDAPPELGLPKRSGCASLAPLPRSDERLIVYARLNDNDLPAGWRMRLADGEQTLLDQHLDAGTPTSYPRAVGGADVDGDGREEWFVKVLNLAGHGTSWGTLNVFVLQDRLRVVTFEGEPMPLYVGGVSRTGEGIACSDGSLVLLRAEARNRQNTNWDTSARYFSVEDAEATLEGREEGVLELSDYNDPDLNPYYELNCRDLHYSV